MSFKRWEGLTVKQPSKKRKLTTLLLLALALTLWATSCRSFPRNADPVVIEPVKLALTWPAFPDPAGVVAFDEATGKISMPLAYWEKIAMYAIDVERNIDIVEAAYGSPKP